MNACAVRSGKTEEEKANEKDKCAREVEEKANRKGKRREKGERASEEISLSTFDSHRRRPAISTLRFLSSSSDDDDGAESEKRMQAKRTNQGRGI